MKPILELKTIQPSIIILFILLFTNAMICGCKCKNGNAERIEKKIEIPKDDITFQQDVTIVLREYITKLDAEKKDSNKYLSWHEVAKDIYKQEEYKPLWICKEVLTQKGKEMFHFLGTAEFLGLNKELYDYEKIQQMVDSSIKILPAVDYNLAKKLEVGLTRSFFQIALHIDHGMFADTILGINSNFWYTKEKYISLLQKALTDSISKTISSLEPKNPLYNRYMYALRDFVSKNNISDNPISIRNPKLDSIGAVYDAQKALVYHHYLIDSSKNNDTIYLRALKKFQKDNNLNGDGAIGSNTIKALERDNSKKFQLLAINADRWRKEHIIDLPEKYVWVNLPSYKLKIIEKDTLRLEKNVVIGKSNLKNETPILESAINQIVLWPTWSVPQSIVKNEMKSFKGFNVITTGSYTRVVQPPGNSNALGCVKILFPNKYSVYIHDTPTKRLFGADFRAASHGCVRCQDPLEVASYLMTNDTFQMSYDSLIALKDRKVATQTFRLKKSVPVYFRYFTAEADFYGNVKFYADVYNRDKQLINFIFKGKQPHILTKEEKRERQIADSLAVIEKKKADSITAVVKLKKEQEKLVSLAVNYYSPKADTTSTKQDSL